MKEKDFTLRSGGCIHYYEHITGTHSVLYIHAQGICGNTFQNIRRLVAGAMSDEDSKRVRTPIENITITHDECGHGIHTEQENVASRAKR